MSMSFAVDSSADTLWALQTTTSSITGSKSCCSRGYFSPYSTDFDEEEDDDSPNRHWNQGVKVELPASGLECIMGAHFYRLANYDNDDDDDDDVILVQTMIQECDSNEFGAPDVIRSSSFFSPVPISILKHDNRVGWVPSKIRKSDSVCWYMRTS
ncbi:hypothetical protein LXL04_036499 [Taraxacum kok-saghyz]